MISALLCLIQRHGTTRDGAIGLCTMTDANTIPDGIVCASVVTACFLFIAMLDTEAIGFGDLKGDAGGGGIG